MKPTTVYCNRIPQHLQVDTIATDGNCSWHSCQFVRLRFFYSKLWSYTIANWCFSSSNILSVTTLTQLNSAVCLEHPNLRDNSFLWSCRQSWTWGERAGPPPPRVYVASSVSRHSVMLGRGQSFAWAIKLKEINFINSYCCSYKTLGLPYTHE